ncbi:phosphatase RsbU N-terminal domain-containing protein [Pseudonocardia broussonetiae]|uniref:Phosphoserine phosphatase RsbU N-terminal domain-containing protein n=1 Tax=Pseudonocardia broussonetiae TaxID=2736640 RepID=A0A6M6JKH8_9PSEU|nr:phosphatase RsbU N-terminal domain-containing protein [Pseudonocardia broussonetiae]QJY47560.1 hypothetical protein HOP40_18525 [Pseudonocardia broussonetiae]
MSAALERLRRNYGVGFLRYLGRRDESSLLSAYEIGRAGLTGGVGLLDVVQVHHTVLLDALRTARPDEIEDVAEAAAAFLVEVLASFEMTNRAALARAAAPPRGDAPTSS